MNKIIISVVALTLWVPLQGQNLTLNKAFVNGHECPLIEQNTLQTDTLTIKVSIIPNVLQIECGNKSISPVYVSWHDASLTMPDEKAVMLWPERTDLRRPMPVAPMANVQKRIVGKAIRDLNEVDNYEVKLFIPFKDAEGKRIDVMLFCTIDKDKGKKKGKQLPPKHMLSVISGYIMPTENAPKIIPINVTYMYRLAQKFHVGVGVGVDFASVYGEANQYNEFSLRDVTAFSAFGRLKLRFARRPTSTFMLLDVGYSQTINDTKYDYNALGLFGRFSFGCDIALKHGWITPQIGIGIHSMSYTMDDGTINDGTAHTCLSFLLGYTF